ncbi:MAG: hypothetical protein ACI89X_003649 [Planctomycetota bacterium]|jgi:hypothetical protein
MPKKYHVAITAALLLTASLSWPGGGPPADASSHHDLSTFKDVGSGRLHRAVQMLGSRTPAVLFADTDDMLGVDLKIPKNISLVHLGGGTIQLAGHDLTVTGAFVAAQTRVFAGDGTVRFSAGSVSQIVPQWWGDNTSQNVQKALNAAGGCGAELFLPAGQYHFGTTAQWLFTEIGDFGRGLTVRGEGPGHTVIQNQTGGRPAFFFGTANAASQQGWFLNIEGIEVTSPNSSGSVGFEIEDVWNGRISECRVSDHALDGLLMSADLNDFGQPKTWTIENCVFRRNGRYGINLAAPGDATVAYNMRLDHLDIQLNAKGGIFAATELSQITNSLIGNNGVGPTSHGGIYMTGITGYRVYENLIADCGFEANVPFDIYADRVANLTIARNDHSRVPQTSGLSEDQFIRLDGPQGAFNVIVEHNQFSSGLGGPFTAILGGTGLQSIDVDNNRFNLPAGNTHLDVASTTKSTRRTLGDTVLTNQTIEFANSVTGVADARLRRGGPGILAAEGFAATLQSLSSSAGVVQVDCSLGLTILVSLTENTNFPPPLNPVPGSILNFSVLQPSATGHGVSFDPIFKKTATPFRASGLHFSTIRFLYTGLYWVQLGASAIDAPL